MVRVGWSRWMRVVDGGVGWFIGVNGGGDRLYIVTRQ